MSDRFVQIDQDGFLTADGLRIQDEEYGRSLLTSFRRDDRHRVWAHYEGIHALVEYYDEPLVARHVERRQNQWQLLAPYEYQVNFDPKSLSVDEWDRFHGATETAIPFVFSRSAQFEFFDLLDSFDDESVTIDGLRIEPPPWLLPHESSEGDLFWSEIYRNETPRWDLGSPSPALKGLLPQLKLPRLRILVLGCGSGHDAAYLASQGHVVTGVDFSEEAIQQAKSLYGSAVRFVESDVFDLPEEFNHAFDLIFEHTCYCAISPSRRNDLVQVWRKSLTPQGQLLGIFFAVDRRSGPPWGGSEYEVHRRLEKYFSFHYWTRWRHSTPNRQGTEFIVFAEIKNR